MDHHCFGNPEDSAVLKQLNDEVLALTTRFPLYEK